MSRKGENIYKRKDGRWEGRYIKGRDENNKAKYGYVYAYSYREVKKKLNIFTANISNMTAAYTSAEVSVYFYLVANEWLDTMAPQFKESTYAKYYNLLNKYILPDLGKIQIEQISTEHIERLCNKLLLSGGKNGKGLSSKTVSDTLGVLRNIMRYAISKGSKSSCDINSLQIKHSTKEMRVLSISEQQKLCEYLYANLNMLNVGILLCLFTGIRVGEICALHWDDISFSEKTIYIHQTIQRIQCHGTENKTKIIVTAPKSQCSIRTIPIPENIIKIIMNLSVTKQGYFLSSNTQKYIEPRTMQNHFKKVLKNASINTANFHSLRHTFATRCIEIGFDVKSLSVILGHSSINITMNRYVHPSMELKRQNMQRLNELFTVK